MNTIDEKTFKQGLDEFIGCAPEGGWSDYWAMQQDWEFYKDSLCRDGVITQKQADSWSNPCTPETFARWQKRNGLVSRGYESKKSEASYDYQDPRGGTAASLFSLHMKELLGSWIKAGNRSKYKVYVTEDRSAGSPVWNVHIDVNGEPVASVSFSDGNYTYTRFDNNKTTTGKVADFNKRGRVIYPMATEILNMVGTILGEGDSNESKKSEDAGNAIQQFAGEHGKDTDKSLAKDFQSAVEAVIGDNGKVIDAWVDAPLRNTHSTAWNASIVSDDMEADGREVCVTLYTPFDGRNYLVCDFWDKDGNIIDSVKGDYGDFDLLAMFKKCIGVSESKKSEALTKDTIVVGQIFNSNLKWIERTLKQVKKKFPNVESDAFGNTLTIRGKLSDVSDVCDTYKTGSYMLCQDNGDAFLPNAAGDDLDDAEISKALSESKKSEGIGDRIKMGIDYNMFMRMCGSAAYLDDNEDYWDALWEYYSEMGEIEDACEFFDNLFQYTAWCDADTVYDEYLDDKFKDESKSKEECIQAAIDDGDLDAYKHDSGNYLVIS